MQLLWSYFSFLWHRREHLYPACLHGHLIVSHGVLTQLHDTSSSIDIDMGSRVIMIGTSASPSILYPPLDRGDGRSSEWLAILGYFSLAAWQKLLLIWYLAALLVGGQSSGLSHANNAETLTSSKVALFELYTLAMNVSHLVKSSFVGCLRSMPSNSS